MSLSVAYLNKRYGTQQVLKDLSFSIGDGEIVGFLGPNGAGKSTTMKILTGCLQPDGGRITLEDIDVLLYPNKAQALMGYLPENNPLYVDMYVKEYLYFVAGLYKMNSKLASERVDEMIERTGLTNEYKKRICHLSKGYRQRVGLAQAMIHDPKVLVLDEPTTGLDPNQVIEIRELIKDFGRDRTVLFSTHIMQEVTAVCNRFLVLRKGELVADMKTSELDGRDLEKIFFSLTN